MLTQLSPVRPVRRGVLGSVPSFGLLFILVAVRVPRDGSGRCAGLLAALGSGGCMARRPSHSRDDHRRARRKRGTERHFFVLCLLINMFEPRASLPPYLGGLWCEGSSSVFVSCFLYLVFLDPGPRSVGVGFTNLGKSKYRTPGFWIGKFLALRRVKDCFMNTFFVQ